MMMCNVTCSDEATENCHLTLQLFSVIQSFKVFSALCFGLNVQCVKSKVSFPSHQILTLWISRAGHLPRSDEVSSTKHFKNNFSC